MYNKNNSNVTVSRVCVFSASYESLLAASALPASQTGGTGATRATGESGNTHPVSCQEMADRAERETTHKADHHGSGMEERHYPSVVLRPRSSVIYALVFDLTYWSDPWLVDRSIVLTRRKCSDKTKFLSPGQLDHCIISI